MELKSKLAVQMYTIREFTKTEKGLQESLQKISEMGYPSVQVSAVGALEGENATVNARQMKAMLDENGLTCCATHRSFHSLRDKTEQEIEFHQTLNCNYVAIGGLPGEYEKANEEGYRRFIADAAEVSAKLKSAGIGFGYHNHAHEFRRFESSRRTLFDLFIEEGGANLLLEIDVYWAVHAGVNPISLFERVKGRVPVTHLKDKEVVAGEEPVMAAIGEGNLDWKNILPALDSAGVEWYCVEQDVCRRDPFDCLRSSYHYLTTEF